MTQTRSTNFSAYLKDYPKLLTELQLPTKKECLLEYLFQYSNHPKNNPSFLDLKDPIIEKLISIYQKVPQAVISKSGVEKKIKDLVERFNKIKKSDIKSSKVRAFQSEMDCIFDISYCKCPLRKEFSKNMMSCTCPPDFRIHESKFDFICDQRGQREMEITNKVDKTLTSKINQTVGNRNLVLERTGGMKFVKRSSYKDPEVEHCPSRLVICFIENNLI